MTALFVASVIVRLWTRLYTWRLPAAARDLRRAEIDSDLWEFRHDSASQGHLGPAFHVLARLLLGMPDDLSWRASHVSLGSGPLRAAISLAAMAVFAAGVWVYVTTRPTELPSPVPLVRFTAFDFPPPPPPPPPPRPPRSLRR